MANRTDPLVSALSGSDPQNLMPYITRKKIYDSRYWKEECFGLSVSDVLEKAATGLHCIGGLPTYFLSLTLKLLQLHPESDLIIESFVDQDDFKYVRALGLFYLRLTGSPADIYESLEDLYDDSRPLRCWISPSWSITYMDEWVHSLLHEPIVLGIALPRLPQRRVLQEAGYLPDGPRPTKLQSKLDDFGGPILYLKHKALVEKHPEASKMWEARQGTTETEQKEKKEKRPKKKAKKYGNLFKTSSAAVDDMSIETGVDKAKATEEGGSEEYWNAERSRLGLAPLK